MQALQRVTVCVECHAAMVLTCVGAARRQPSFLRPARAGAEVKLLLEAERRFWVRCASQEKAPEGAGAGWCLCRLRPMV